jgi:hypothetical protein
VERQLAHLSFIQNIITRMGSNSFLLKGWSVTLIAALFALSAKDANHLFLLVGFVPNLGFWGLDAYFLRQERLYRALYAEVAAGRVSSELLSLDTAAVSGQVLSLFQAARTNTLLFFHGMISLVVAIAVGVVLF